LYRLRQRKRATLQRTITLTLVVNTGFDWTIIENFQLRKIFMNRLARILTSALLCSVTCATLARPGSSPKATATLTASSFDLALGELAPSGTFQGWLEQLPGFAFSPATARLLKTEFGTAHLFSATAASTSPGVRNYTMQVPARKYNAPNGHRYTWLPMHATFAVHEDDATVVSEGRAPRLSMQDKDGRIVLQEVAFSTKGRRGASGFFNGDFAGTIGKLTVGVKQTSGAMTLNNLSLSVNITEEPGALGLRYEAGIGAFRFQGMQLDDIKIAAHIDNMDTEAIRVFQQMAASFGDTEGMSPAARGASMHPLWEELVTRLASKGARVELDNFQIGYQGNIARMKGSYRFENIKPGDFADPAILNKKMVIHAELRVPLSMARAINIAVGGKKPAALPRGANAATIAAANHAYVSEALLVPIAMGLMRIDDDMVVSTINMRDGVVFVNGKQMTPPITEGTEVASADTSAHTTGAKED
jgi:hypothetical protein